MTPHRDVYSVARCRLFWAIACACGLAGCDAPVQTTPTATPTASPTATPAAQTQSTTDQVCNIVAKQLGVEKSKLTPTTTLFDLHADELDLVEIVMELEDHFQISIPDSFISGPAGAEKWPLNALTVAKLADIVDTCLKRRRAGGDGEIPPESKTKRPSD